MRLVNGGRGGFTTRVVKLPHGDRDFDHHAATSIGLCGEGVAQVWPPVPRPHLIRCDVVAGDTLTADIPRLVCRQGPPDFESGLATQVRLLPGEPLVQAASFAQDQSLRAPSRLRAGCE